MAYNQENFDKLPALIARSVFLDWSGLSSDELSAEVKAKRIAAYKPPGHKRAKYYKKELAELTKLKM